MLSTNIESDSANAACAMLTVGTWSTLGCGGSPVVSSWQLQVFANN